MSEATKLTRKQESATSFLLTERTQERAAAKAGVSTATLRRWMGTPAFLAAYRHAGRVVVEGAIGQLQRAASGAVSALVRNLRCGTPPVDDNALSSFSAADLDNHPVVVTIHSTFGRAVPRK
jgi:hypothetical protein